ncbi:uncharacterized protein LOC132741865 [Ruditapes philippinarum]|uniref:uncharacterized protein LOC132741865 n=1 Tax=Ruditapes philippinarum TaxID=129788 RepID=UPI00295B0D10|nr:uncharacterized protein LOC132741865 [Ruditapes philippinarum]
MFLVSLEGRYVTDEKPPCFQNDEGIQPEMDMALTPSFERINEHIMYLKAKIESRITQMRKEYCITSDASMVDFTITSQSNSQKFRNDFIGNPTSFFETITGHYEMLNRFTDNLEELSKTAADRYAKQKLLEIQGLVYDAMCSIKIVLKSQYEDPNSKVPGGGNSFQYDNICDQQNAEYLTMLIGYSVADYLNSLYSTVVN